MVDGNKLGDVGFNYIGVSYDTMDCQAFVERCLKDCGCNKDLAGSNAWFREVYKNGAIMTPEECVAQLGTVPKGAFLFILEHDGKEPEKYKPDGLGNASHIGLVTMPRGEGAIHSSKSKGGVCESKFKGKTVKNGGWNRVGLWNQVSYDYGGGGGDEPQPEPTPAPEQQYAEVWSENGKPVNTRKGPDTSYPQAGPGKLAVGTVVEIEKTQGDWSYIKYTDSYNAVWYCWMKSEFLKPMVTPGHEPDPDEPAGELFTVIVHQVTEDEAYMIKNAFPGHCEVVAG